MTPESGHGRQRKLIANPTLSATGRKCRRPDRRGDSDGSRGLPPNAVTPYRWRSELAPGEARRAISWIRSAALSDKAPGIQAEAR